VGVTDGVAPQIGQAVQVEFNMFEGDLTLPQFRLMPMKESS